MQNKKLQEALKERFEKVTQEDLEQKFIQLHKARVLHNNLKRAVSSSLGDWAMATIPRFLETNIVDWYIDFHGNSKDDPDGKYLFYITTECDGKKGLETLDIKSFLNTDWVAERAKREKEDIESIREHTKLIIKRMAANVGLVVEIKGE